MGLLLKAIQVKNLYGRVREEREVNMGSSSSSYAPKTIYLDVGGKVQKVRLTNVENVNVQILIRDPITTKSK